MKCVKRLTADQQRLAEENLTIVERVLRFDINANPCVAGLGYEDLYQEGCVWLCNAALTFDPARGSFASYARQVVQNGLVSYCRNLTGKQSRMISLAEMEPTALAALEVQHSAPFDIEVRDSPAACRRRISIQRRDPQGRPCAGVASLRHTAYRSCYSHERPAQPRFGVDQPCCPQIAKR